MDFGMPRQGAQACQHNLINHCLGKDVGEFQRYESIEVLKFWKLLKRSNKYS